ncbi:MAG: hypothetical protein AAFP17_03355 [Pseudomonadota bacterium]
MFMTRTIVEIVSATVFCVGVQMLLGYIPLLGGLDVASVKIAVAISAVLTAVAIFSRLNTVRTQHFALAIGLVGAVLSADLLIGEDDTQNADNGISTEQLLERFVPAPHRCVGERCVG